MTGLSYLLYILGITTTSPSVGLIKSVRHWLGKSPVTTVDRELMVRFCSGINLNPKQKTKFLENYSSHPESVFGSRLNKNNISVVNYLEPDFPALLLEAPDHPLQIYYKGNLSALNYLPFAIVGSRKQTNYSELILKKIIRDLRGYNLNVISGLAFGVDSTAHHLAIQNQIATTAVMATGLDDESLYPRSNLKLTKQILDGGGLLISEYPPKTPALPFQFVARNRIIAGLSKAVVVVEAAQKSGSLITASLALEYNRTVFAVPGSVFSNLSCGTNSLLKAGAEVLTCAEDLIGFFDLSLPKPKLNNTQRFSSSELRVLECIKQPTTFDELLSQTKLQATELQSILMQLELNQVISQIHPQTFVLT